MANDNGAVSAHSVMADEIAANSIPGGVWHILMAPSGSGLAQATGLPPYWSHRQDLVLRSTLDMESMWAGAVYKAVTKGAALGWEVKDTADSGLRVRRAQDIALLADDGKGWVSYYSKTMQDALLTNNGWFTELVWAGAKLLGVMHLDSYRCTRTGDPEIPVLYTDRLGRVHEMEAHTIMFGAELPDAGENWNGVGHCAANRAWHTIVRMAAIRTYQTEKTSGSRELSIYVLSGISDKQLQGALATADNDRAARGFVHYKGAIVIPTIDTATTPGVIEIPLSALPDGFDVAQEVADAAVVYANNIGVAVQDVTPLTGQGLGTGTQTVILDEAAEGMGLSAFRKDFFHQWNEMVLPDTTTISWSTNDIRDQKAQAEVKKLRAERLNLMQSKTDGTGYIDAAQALQIATDEGDVPKEFLPTDQTPGATVEDDEKPVEETSLSPAAAVAAVTRPATPNSPQPVAAPHPSAAGPQSAGSSGRQKALTDDPPTVEADEIAKALAAWRASVPEPFKDLLDARPAK